MPGKIDVVVVGECWRHVAYFPACKQEKRGHQSMATLQRMIFLCYPWHLRQSGQISHKCRHRVQHSRRLLLSLWLKPSKTTFAAFARSRAPEGRVTQTNVEDTVPAVDLVGAPRYEHANPSDGLWNKAMSRTPCHVAQQHITIESG